MESDGKQMENPTKSCKACKAWGGCPPGRPCGPQPTGWLVKPDPHDGPNNGENTTTKAPLLPKIAAPHKRPILMPG